MKLIHIFKKGDEVPAWIIEVHPKYCDRTIPVLRFGRLVFAWVFRETRFVFAPLGKLHNVPVLSDEADNTQNCKLEVKGAGVIIFYGLRDVVAHLIWPRKPARLG